MSRHRYAGSLALGAAGLLLIGLVLTLGMPRLAAADDATAGVRYHFYKPGADRQLSPTLRRDLRKPSVSGNRLLLNNPNKAVSGVERSKAERYERNVGQAIRRLERAPGARDGRTTRRLRVLRSEQRRMSRGLSRTR